MPRSRLLASLLGAVLPFLALAGPAGAVPRSTALSTVTGSILLPSPQSGLLKAFSPPAALAPGTIVQEGIGSSVTVVGSPSWFVWIDYSPISDFGHSTGFVLVDTLTGLVTLNRAGSFWPKISGVDYYRTETSRAPGSPDLFYSGGGLKPRVGPGAAPRVVAPLGTLLQFADEHSWGVIVTGEPIAGGANPGRAANVDSARKAMTNDFGVPAGNITTISPTSKADLLAKLRAIMKDCPKLYFYWTGHGLPHKFFFDADCITDAELAHELKDMKASEYCCILTPCYSGSFLPALRDSGIGGFHIASTESTTVSKRWEPGDDTFVGGFFEHFWKDCLDKGLRKEAARKWADSLMTHYIDSLNAANPGWNLPPQHPQASQVFVITFAGQASGFDVPAGFPTVCITYKTGSISTCANSSVYCLAGTGGWIETKHWNWNTGQIRYFNPPALGAGYELVIHSNSYPVCGAITMPANLIPETPNSQLIVPAYSLGWRDGLGSEFDLPSSFGNGPGPLIPVVPGLDLRTVPLYTGGLNHHDDLTLLFPLQPDPTRPFLYQGNNPSQPFTGPTTVLISASDIWMDDLGTPAGALPIMVTLTQGLSQLFATTVATRQPGGSITVPSVSFPPILAQGFRIKLTPQTALGAPAWPGSTPAAISRTTLPGAGVLALDAVTVITRTTGTLGVDEGLPDRIFMVLSPPSPNPTRGKVQFRLGLSQDADVRLGVYDVNGRSVRSLLSGRMPAGDHSLRWDGKDAAGRQLPTGVYYARCVTGGRSQTQKLVLLR